METTPELAQRPVPGGAAGLDASVPVVTRTRAELAHARGALTGRVGVVMTMGALHEGHAALIREARRSCDAVVVTIFLNPLQFGPSEDMARYPRTFDADLALCTREGVDLVFAPGPDVVYPDGDPGVRVSAGRLGEVLEGRSRPGHFDGVLTVVAKLLHLTRPAEAYFGQKDAQQLLHDPAHGPRPRLRMRRGRRPDRARTGRPGDEQPQHVPVGVGPRGGPDAGRSSLRAGEAAASEGASAVRRAARAVLVAEPLVLVDYLVLVEPESLADVPEWYRGPALLAVAARVGTTRLIDNALLSVGQATAPR